MLGVKSENSIEIEHHAKKDIFVFNTKLSQQMK